MFVLEVGYLRRITTGDAAGAGILRPVHVLLTHRCFCLPELLVHFSAFTMFHLKFILNTETEPIFIPRPHGREVTLTQMLRHLWSRITYISHSLLRLVFAYIIFSAFKIRFSFTTQNFKLRNTDLDPEEKQ